MDILLIPHINAVLNAMTIVLMVMGRAFAKAGNESAHKKAMISTLVVSAVFLVFYTTYHFAGGFAKFGGEGLIRWVYFPILIIHVLGAIAITPLVPMAVYKAIKGNREGHKRLVRFTWPLWFFVATSGVFVYTMAFHLYPYTG